MKTVSYEKPTRKNFKDLTGQVFSRLTIQSFDRIERKFTEEGIQKETIVYWNCLCECGQSKIIEGSSMKSGNTKSCGCYHKERVSEVKTTHGITEHPLYQRCQNMIGRCHNQKHTEYQKYGGRGISVCDRWRNNITLMVNEVTALIGLPSFEGAQIDRIDNDKGYIQGNIHWVTPEENNRNRRVSHNHRVDPITKKGTPTWHSWHRLIKYFKDQLCIEWISDNNPNTTNGFQQFLSDMGEKPWYGRRTRTPLMRYDESKPFSKNNSYWS